MLIKPFEPGRLGREQALVGPDRNPDEAVVDPVMGRALDEVLSDHEPIDIQYTWPSNKAEGYELGYTYDGAIALRDGDIVGGLLGPDLAVDPDHRNQGLGTELVIEEFVRHGGLETWAHDQPGYSPSGAAIVEGACTVARTNELFIRKVARSLTQQLERSRELQDDLEEFKKWCKQHDYAEAVRQQMIDEFDLVERLPKTVAEQLRSTKNETVDAS